MIDPGIRVAEDGRRRCFYGHRYGDRGAIKNLDSVRTMIANKDKKAEETLARIEKDWSRAWPNQLRAW
jgi:hypothetical protein